MPEELRDGPYPINPAMKIACVRMDLELAREALRSLEETKGVVPKNRLLLAREHVEASMHELDGVIDLL